jgi:hypothetical protein
MSCPKQLVLIVVLPEDGAISYLFLDPHGVIARVEDCS